MDMIDTTYIAANGKDRIHHVIHLKSYEEADSINVYVNNDGKLSRVHLYGERMDAFLRWFR